MRALKNEYNTAPANEALISAIAQYLILSVTELGVNSSQGNTMRLPMIYLR